MIIDNEFRNLIPRLTAEEYAQLEKNIVTEGCRDALVTWQGILIDGHNRYEICKKHGIPYRTVEMDFADKDTVIDWIINNQLGRRNLTPANQSYLRGLQYQREKAKHGGDRKSEESKAQNEPLISTAEKLAEQHKVSPATIKRDAEFTRGLNNLARVLPEIKEEVLQGKSELTKQEVSSFASIVEAEVEKKLKEIDREKQARKEAKQKRIEQAKQRILEESNQAVEKNKPLVYLESCETWLDKMQECDLLLTDPPYSTDVEDLEGFLNKWFYKALSKVKDTGRAYIFIGAYPNEVKAYLNAKVPEHLKLEQILIWTYKNTLGQNPSDRYKLNYQNCLYFKGVNASNLDCPLIAEQWAVQEINAPDGRQGDRYHAWQKPLEIAERFIRHSTKPGDIVLDPFCCTGTFIIAANKLGRRGYGCDISKDNLDIAIQRGCILDEYSSSRKIV